MKLDLQMLQSLKSLRPETLISHAKRLQGEDGWVIVKKASAISVGVAAAGATELALTAILAPTIFGKFLAPVVAGSVGVFAERKTEQLLEHVSMPTMPAMPELPKMPKFNFKMPRLKPIVQIPV